VFVRREDETWKIIGAFVVVCVAKIGGTQDNCTLDLSAGNASLEGARVGGKFPYRPSAAAKSDDAEPVGVAAAQWRLVMNRHQRRATAGGGTAH
jgi:hypothetical protein